MKHIFLFFKDFTISKQIIIALLPLVSILIGMKTLFVGLLILVIMDLITGITKNLRGDAMSFSIFNRKAWLLIKSRNLRDTVNKAYSYGALVIVAAVIEAFILGVTPISLMDKTFTLTELVIVACSGIEVWSIFENIEAVTKVNPLKKLVIFLPGPLRKLFSK